MGFLVLAQDLEGAAKGLSLLERIQAGGVPLICLALAVVMGGFAFWQLKRNNAFQARQLEAAELRETKAQDLAEDRVKKTREGAAERERAKEESHNRRLAEQESLLREMLDRDREAQEGQLATAKALEGYTAAHMDNRRLMEEALASHKETRRMMEDSLRRLDLIERKLPT